MGVVTSTAGLSPYLHPLLFTLVETKGAVMDFTLNGESTSVQVRDGMSLLDLLREACALTSVKDGCAPEGSCGACTVMVDGKAVVSCAQPANRASGRSVTTQEGLPAGTRQTWAHAFVAAGASQCGF